jgi:hypothetical protein
MPFVQFALINETWRHDLFFSDKKKMCKQVFAFYKLPNSDQTSPDRVPSYQKKKKKHEHKYINNTLSFHTSITNEHKLKLEMTGLFFVFFYNFSLFLPLSFLQTVRPRLISRPVPDNLRK